MRIVLSEHVDPETGDRWELIEDTPALTYAYWMVYYRPGTDYPHATIPFTPSAEKWRAEIMNEKEIRK